MDATDQFRVLGSGNLFSVRLFGVIGSHCMDLFIIKLLGTFPVLLGLCHNLFFADELHIFVMAQLVVSEQLADPKANLGLRPILEMIASDLLECGGSMSEHTFDEELGFLTTPVVAFLDVEVLEVQ